MNAIEKMHLEALKEENRRLKEEVAEYHRLKAQLPHIVEEAAVRGAEKIKEER